MSRSLDPKTSRYIRDGPPLVPDVFPGDACGECRDHGDVPAARKEAVHHGWRVLATLRALMGFASIFTDLYLPAMPAMSTSLGTGFVILIHCFLPVRT